MPAVLAGVFSLGARPFVQQSTEPHSLAMRFVTSCEPVSATPMPPLSGH